MVSEPYATSSAVYSTTGNCQLAAPATCLRAPSMNQGVHACVCVCVYMLICMLHLYACGCRLLTLIPTDEVGVLCAVDGTHAAGHAAPPHCLSPTTDTNCSTAPPPPPPPLHSPFAAPLLSALIKSSLSTKVISRVH